MPAEKRGERDRSHHPLSDRYYNDRIGMVPLGEDTIRILRREYIYYVNDTVRGLPCRGLDWVDLTGHLLFVQPYEFVLRRFKPAPKVSVYRARRDWTGDSECLHREVLARGDDPEPSKADLARRVRAGEFD